MKKEYDFSEGKRGAVIRTPPGKTRIMRMSLVPPLNALCRSESAVAGSGLAVLRKSRPARSESVTKIVNRFDAVPSGKK